MQTGENAPVSTVLENTIGDIVWSYEGVGGYRGTLAGVIVKAKTWCEKTLQSITTDDPETLNIFTTINDNYISITAHVDGVGVDDLIDNIPIEIRVYY